MKLRRDYVEMICNMSKNIQPQNMCMRACVRICFAEKHYDPLQHSTFRYSGTLWTCL